ncbi:hypothetical protein BSKO_02789 [Bryopsis sp. KO-2023]|nr:hypothetical protein BSKO_02789 [Bryopsis sp. KO-2023]
MNTLIARGLRPNLHTVSPPPPCHEVGPSQGREKRSSHISSALLTPHSKLRKGNASPRRLAMAFLSGLGEQGLGAAKKGTELVGSPQPLVVVSWRLDCGGRVRSTKGNESDRAAVAAAALPTATAKLSAGE